MQHPGNIYHPSQLALACDQSLSALVTTDRAREAILLMRPRLLDAGMTKIMFTPKGDGDLQIIETDGALHCFPQCIQGGCLCHLVLRARMGRIVLS